MGAGNESIYLKCIKNALEKFILMPSIITNSLYSSHETIYNNHH